MKQQLSFSRKPYKPNGCTPLYSRSGVLLVFLALLTLIGCGSKKREVKPADLAGQWTGTFNPTPTYTAPVTATFEASGNWQMLYQMRSGPVTTRGTFTLEGETLHMQNTVTGENFDRPFSLYGNTLTLKQVPFAGSIVLTRAQ